MWRKAWVAKSPTPEVAAALFNSRQTPVYEYGSWPICRNDEGSARFLRLDLVNVLFDDAPLDLQGAALPIQIRTFQRPAAFSASPHESIVATMKCVQAGVRGASKHPRGHPAQHKLFLTFFAIFALGGNSPGGENGRPRISGNGRIVTKRHTGLKSSFVGYHVQRVVPNADDNNARWRATVLLKHCVRHAVRPIEVGKVNSWLALRRIPAATPLRRARSPRICLLHTAEQRDDRIHIFHQPQESRFEELLH